MSDHRFFLPFERFCHLLLEVVPEVGHECMILLPALIDVFNQFLGFLLQDFNARLQGGEGSWQLVVGTEVEI